MKKKLLILGAGQHGQVAKETAELMQEFDIIDFLDDNSTEAIGRLEDVKKFKSEYEYAFVAFGNNALRIEWIYKVENLGYKVATLVNPKAFISPSAILGEGGIAEAGVVVNTKTIIGKGCLLSIGALVDHDSNVGAGCHIETGAVVMPNKKVPAGVTVKENSVYMEE